MSDDADKQLLMVVNYLGLAVFSLVVVYHYITSSEKDAE
jgi:hypothetical protein